MHLLTLQVSKGPDSPGAVRIARELGGVTVRGNHEFEVMCVWRRTLLTHDISYPRSSLSLYDGTPAAAPERTCCSVIRVLCDFASTFGVTEDMRRH